VKETIARGTICSVRRTARILTQRSANARGYCLKKMSSNSRTNFTTENAVSEKLPTLSKIFGKTSEQGKSGRVNHVEHGGRRIERIVRQAVVSFDARLQIDRSHARLDQTLDVNSAKHRRIARQ